MIIKKYNFRHRECSLNEAAYRIEGLDMVKASRKTKTIVPRAPMYRDQLLKPGIAELHDSEDIFVPGLFDHYAQRPNILEPLCICDFAAWFEFSSYRKKVNIQNEEDNEDNQTEDVSDNLDNDEFLSQFPYGTEFKLKDGSGYVTKRKFRCILKYRRSDNDILENARSTLLLFKSFRDEDSEIHNADLHKVMEDNREEIERNQRKYEKNASLFDNIEELEQLFKDSEEEYLVDPEEERELENVEEVMDFENEFSTYTQNPRKDKETDKLAHEELKLQVRKLNAQQRSLFDDMVERYSLPLGILEPLLLHIQGAAGTGKSFLLITLIDGVRYVIERRKISISPEQPTVMVGAPTNNAAFNIGGKTIHSLLGFGFSDEETNAYAEVNGEIAKDLPWKFSNTRLMVLDEISMVGTNLFSKISLRLQEILNLLPSWKFKSFGGLDMVLLGKLFVGSKTDIFKNFVCLR